jgi:iron(II)-dependent oxidoreductase
MNLELPLNEIKKRLWRRNYFIKSDNILDQLNETFALTKKFMGIVINNEKLEYLTNKKVGTTNPLRWEFGHVLFFWKELILDKLGIELNVNTRDIYDSFKTSWKNRFSAGLIDMFSLVRLYEELMLNLTNFILVNNKLSSFESYLLRLGHLHQEMHNESFIFTLNCLDVNPIKYVYKPEKSLIANNIMINVPSGSFKQGTDKGFFFDNEAPEFVTNVDEFEISKYCITNYEYLNFVESGGYSKHEYWLREGWKWIENNKINNPVYWKYDKKDNIWLEKIFGEYHRLRLNDPVRHISYYEASAYCKWAGGRLPKESEWEYLTTFFYEDYKNKGNLNYKNKGVVSVLEDKNENTLGIVGLYGNVWEWCLEPIYPYDGFIIDPVYREMSYPFFGYKRICRGGAWCVPDYLVTKSYRNAQPMDCRIQYIGFRIVKD